MGGFALPKAFMIAGIGSGCGKTTVTSAIICALKAKGYRVQPFKVGPDYIDPQHHSFLAGKSCRSLDCWLMGVKGVKENFYTSLKDTDVAVIEGVGGIYDGLGVKAFASSAYVARLLDVPVFLVVDVWGISRTAAAMVKGIKDFEDVRIAGVIFNFLGSEGHYRLMKEIMNTYMPDVPVVGGLIRSKKGIVPERHLGILQAHEINWEERRNVLLELAQSIDLERILELSADKRPQTKPPTEKNFSVKVAVAKDRAFSFIYPESEEALKSLGAELAFFSPVDGETIPTDAQALLLPGGYPEVWGERLVENRRFIKDLKEFAKSGLPVYAECGGLIFLAEKVHYKGKTFPFAGVLPIEVDFAQRPFLGYARAKALRNHPFLKEGSTVRGHVFHYSVVKEKDPLPKGYRLFVPSKGISLEEGFTKGNLFATYLHLNLLFGPSKDLAIGFLTKAL